MTLGQNHVLKALWGVYTRYAQIYRTPKGAYIDSCPLKRANLRLSEGYIGDYIGEYYKGY